MMAVLVTFPRRVFGSPGDAEEGQLPLLWWPLTEPLTVALAVAVTQRQL